MTVAQNSAQNFDVPQSPLVIVGPTASGKSALALAIAQRFDHIFSPTRAEIVSADAMAVYRGMDIGTAKPSEEEQQLVPHHVIDMVDVSDGYTVSQFQADANRAIADIEASGGAAIVVGGTGLYVQSVIDNFTVPDSYPEVRAELEQEADSHKLWERLNGLDPVAAAKMEPTNHRRIVRALEVTLGSGAPFSSFGPGVDHYGETRFVLAGLEIDRSIMDQRIDDRYRQQMENGFLDEVKSLYADAALSRTAAQALGYRELLNHLKGQYSLEEALDEAQRRTKKFARRQQRWFRRDPRITWFDAASADNIDDVFDYWLAQSRKLRSSSGLT